jgi:hypothetical protein
MFVISYNVCPFKSSLIFESKAKAYLSEAPFDLDLTYIY